jgi:hypothetical protein
MSLFRTLNEATGIFHIAVPHELIPQVPVYGSPCPIERFTVKRDSDGTYYVEKLGHATWVNKREFLKVFLTTRVFYILQGSQVIWCHENKPASIIQRAWRRHRLRTTRDKNDLVIRGLAEYFGHPRFQNFSVECF